MKQSIITLITDFGLCDEYVGVMKGVMASVNPSATVIDISHHISPQNIVHAAYTLYFSYQYFPENTIHVIVVDPGVGSNRKIVALQTEQYFFLSPDNGILTLILKNHQCTCVEIDRSEFFLSTVSSTFHGRDIFAPVAAHLSKSFNIHLLGRPILPENLMTISDMAPHFDNQKLIGKVILADRFGNIVSNISTDDLTRIQIDPDHACIHIMDQQINGISTHYNQVKTGELLAIFGSKGLLEISINCGNACQKLGINQDSEIPITLN